MAAEIPTEPLVRRQTALRSWRLEIRGKLAAVRDWWLEHVHVAPKPRSEPGLAAALQQAEREQRERQAVQRAAQVRETAAAVERQQAGRQQGEPQQAEVKRPMQLPHASVLRPRGPRR